MSHSRDDQMYSSFVHADTEQEWFSLQGVLKEKWLYPAGAVERIDFDEEETVEFNFDYNESKIVDVVEKFEVGRVWGEFQVEPILEVAPNQLLHVNKATYLALLKGVPSFTNLERVHVSRELSTDEDIDPNRYLYIWAACPRCFHAAKLTEDDEYLDWDEEYADPDCPSCGGSGEWDLDA